MNKNGIGLIMVIVGVLLIIVGIGTDGGTFIACTSVISIITGGALLGVDYSNAGTNNSYNEKMEMDRISKMLEQNNGRINPKNISQNELRHIRTKLHDAGYPDSAIMGMLDTRMDQAELRHMKTLLKDAGFKL